MTHVCDAQTNKRSAQLRAKLERPSNLADALFEWKQHNVFKKEVLLPTS